MKVKIWFMFVTSLVTKVWFIKADDDFPEKSYMNLSADPCSDFYEFSCGNFKNLFPLDDDTLTIDHFTLLEEKLTKIANEILSEEDYPDDPQALNKSKSAYKACFDTDYLDKVLNPELSVIEAENGFPLVQMPSVARGTVYGFNDIADAVSKYGIPMLFNMITYSNIEDPTKNLIYISPLDATNLSPSEISPIRPKVEDSFETFIDKSFADMAHSNNKYKRSAILLPFDIFLRKMAIKLRNATQSILSDEAVFKNLADVNDFTRGIFKQGIVGNVTINDFPTVSVTLKQLNLWTKEQFNDTIKLDWVEFFQHYFANSGREITEETEVMTYIGLARFLYGIVNLVRQTEGHIIKSYVMMRVFTHLAPESDANSRNYLYEYFKDMQYNILPRWKYCTRKITDATGTAGLSFALAYEYQLRHFNVNLLSKAIELIEDLKVAFKEIIEESAWMDDDSKLKALEKFKNVVTILAHPDVAYQKDELDKLYENLRICKWDNYGNSIRIKAFKNAYQISQISKRDRAFWDKSPFEVNAYYNRPNNKMVFPISMLNTVFFGNKNRILDYARIGAIIGHEMTHGFDEKGMKYGPEGTFETWWTDQTLNGFANRTKCFVDQYNKYYDSRIDAYVNGTITLNENIADNGGVRDALRALKKMLKQRKIDNKSTDFTPEQLFFIGFGTLWCDNPSIRYLQLMKKDEHAFSKFRVNGVVSNMPEFAEAFACPTGSNMNPSDKCLLW